MAGSDTLIYAIRTTVADASPPGWTPVTRYTARMDHSEITKAIAESGAEALLGPFLGRLMVPIFARGPDALVKERLVEFFEELRLEFTSPLADSYDEQFLQSQDFAHLVLLAADHAVRAKKRQRRALYARALRNAASKKWGAQKSDLAEELLNTLADPSKIEVDILGAAWAWLKEKEEPAQDEPQTALTGTVRAENIGPAVAALELTEAEIRAYLGKLQRFGLTEEVTGAPSVLSLKYLYKCTGPVYARASCGNPHPHCV